MKIIEHAIRGSHLEFAVAWFEDGHVFSFRKDTKADQVDNVRLSRKELVVDFCYEDGTYLYPKQVEVLQAHWLVACEYFEALAKKNPQNKAAQHAWRVLKTSKPIAKKLRAGYN